MLNATAAEPTTKELAIEVCERVNKGPISDPMSTVTEFAGLIRKPCRCYLGEPPIGKRAQGGPSKTFRVWLGANEDHHFLLHFYEKTNRWAWEIVTAPKEA